ncbi:MAG: hypothetical protein WB800_43225 [Streptosporangiaceae bacterium]
MMLRAVKRLCAAILGLTTVALLAAACGTASPAASVHAGASPSTTPAIGTVNPASAGVASQANAALLPVLYNFGGSSAADWNLAQRTPVIFYLAADGSAALGDNAHHLNWTKWNNVSAAATGDYYYRTGPCCTYRSDAVTITANDVVRQSANKSWYDRITIRFNKSKSITIQFERIDGSGFWNTVAVPGTSSPSQPATTAATPSGTPDYNIPSQLDAAVLASVEQSSHQSVTRVNCVVWPTNIHMFTCTIYFASAGSDVAGVAVTPNGSSYTIESSG